MANARLHIICGNCGCNDMWQWELIKDFHDYDGIMSDGLVLRCKNCSTNHCLDDYAEKRP